MTAIPSGSSSVRSAVSSVLALSVCAATAGALLLMLLKPVYLGDDASQSYAHVWYLSRSLWKLHQWPYHVALLENGDAIMFPYGLVPWLPDALLRPLLGDWVVTASMVVGVLLFFGAILSFRPSLRDWRLYSLMLLNPLLWNGITQFQLTTFWAFALFVLAANALERQRYILAGAFFALAYAAHPMMGGAAVGCYGAFEYIRLKKVPRALLLVAGLAAVVASPAFWLFASVPLVREGNRLVLALSFLDNFRRLTLILVPLLLARFSVFARSHYLPFAAAGLAGTTLALTVLPPTGLIEQSRPQFADYLAAHPVDPNTSYRVMVKNNYKDGMVEFMQSGAVLSTEFFTESLRRQSFPGVSSYSCFLATKNVGHVVVSGDYLRSYHTNERALLDSMVAGGQATLEFVGRDGTAVYAVHPPPHDRHLTPRACGI